jgi:putative DNA primase/helicase
MQHDHDDGRPDNVTPFPGAQAASNPPPRDGGASTPNEGGGGGKAGRKKREKKTDFGSFTLLLRHFALIYGTDTVWDGLTRRIVKIGTVRLAYGTDTVRMWLGHKARRTVMPEQVVFSPGKDIGPDCINLFDGFAVEPVACQEADVAVMLELLHHLCSRSANTDEGVAAVVHWVLCWLALPLQRPGAKLRTALIFHGPQGTGKNLFFDAVRKVYGKYGVMVGQNELEDKFNDWLSAKLLVIGNEVVTRQELYHNKNRLKWIITEDEIPIRAIQQSVRWEENHANVVFLSNEHQPMALEEGDRRYLVVYTPVGRDDDLYARVARFLEDGGHAKLMHFLQHYDIGDFGEHTKPLMTEAKEDLIELGLKPAERFMKEWLGGLLPLPFQVCSAEQLYRAFRRWCEMTGERYPPPQPQFTKTADRWVQERVDRDPRTGQRLEPRLTYKVVNLKDAMGSRKCVRCWLPRGTKPLNGVSEGEWAQGCIEAFEAALARFGRQNQQQEGDQ